MIDQAASPIRGASLNNEGKLHLGYVYAADPTGLTVPRMIESSARFLPILEALCGQPLPAEARSEGFHYGVLADSRITPDAFLKHALAVDAAVANYLASHPDDTALPVRFDTQPRSALDLEQCFNPETVSAAFLTPEFSVDTNAVAVLVRRALASLPNIHCLLDTRIVAAESGSNGMFRVSVQRDDGLSVRDYDGVVNVLWQNRLKFDQAMGLGQSSFQITRYKAALRAKLGHSVTAGLPSTTFVSGPFGDLVNHGGQSLYLSWYPACRLGIETGGDLTPIETAVSRLDHRRLVQETVEALSHRIPALGRLGLSAENVSVGGGYIVASGSSDIDDPQSELHQRHKFGVTSSGRWVSLDTGKYCAAPLGALNAARCMATALD